MSLPASRLTIFSPLRILPSSYWPRFSSRLRGLLNEPGKRSIYVTGSPQLKRRSIAKEDPQFAIRIHLELLVGGSTGLH